jgi:hypothetical protein
METTGVAEPENEIKYVDFFDGSNLKISNTTWEIIELYRLKKNSIKPKPAPVPQPAKVNNKPSIVHPKKR